jgi:hypothetical protein
MIVSDPKEVIKQQDQLYGPVGKALTLWASVESALCAAYCICVNPLNAYPAVYAFWAIVSFEGKLAATHAAVEAACVTFPNLATEWNAIRNRLIEKNRKRNRIAHGSVVNMGWIKPSTGEQVWDAFLAPYYHHQKERRFLSIEPVEGEYDPRPKDRMYEKEIGEISSGFEKAYDRLRDFNERLSEALVAEARELGA